MIVKKVTIETVEVDWKTLAAEIEQRAMDKLHDDLAHWSNDVGMRAMFLGDAADALRICESLAEEGDWAKAEDLLLKMDTAARDYVYQWIDDLCGEDFFDLVLFVRNTV